MKGTRGVVARGVLAAGQSYAAHTDDAVFHFQRVLAAIRTTFLEAGRRLAQAGKLPQAEDVFYLERDELWVAASKPTEEFMAKIVERRVLREQHKRLAPPPFIPPATDPSWANDAFFKLMPPAMITATFDRGVRQRDGKRVLVGSPSSPGRARG